MNDKQIDKIISLGGAILAVGEIILTLAGRLFLLAKVPRDQVEKLLAGAKARAAEAASKLDDALGND